MIKASKRTIILILIAVLVIWAGWGGYRLFYRFSGQSDSKSFDTSSDTVLVIKAHTADIFISGTDSDVVKIESNKAGELKYSIDGNTITISLADRKYLADGFLTVELPKGIKSASFTTDIGDLDIASASVDSLNLSANTGDIDIVNLKAITADIDADIGDVDISDSIIDETINAKLSTGDLTVEQTSFGNMTATASIGNIEIYGGSFNSIDTTASTGDIKIRLNQNIDQIEIETGTVGDSYIFGEYFENGKHTITKGDGETIIKAKTSIGTIDIDN